VFLWHLNKIYVSCASAIKSDIGPAILQLVLKNVSPPRAIEQRIKEIIIRFLEGQEENK